MTEPHSTRLAELSVERSSFGTTQRGDPADLFTLCDPGVLTVRLTNFGGVVVGIDAPDRHGEMADVVLGFDDVAGYESKDDPYFGAIIGRYANRIAGGRFELGGQTYSLATNNGPNSLHGGNRGFSDRLWQAASFEDAGAVGVVLRLVSPDGDEGYPGELTTEVTYALRKGGTLTIDARATTSATTVVNLSYHAYFNLAGHAAGDILDHRVQLLAHAYTRVDEHLIPTGEVDAVAGTPLDFLRSVRVGNRIDDPHPQLQLGRGYDHNWVVDGRAGELRPAARVEEPASGRVLELCTTEPGLQFYTGNFIEEMAGKGGATYRRRGGLCLEPQHFPDSPNQPQFPSTVLEPGDVYRSRSVLRFSIAP